MKSVTKTEKKELSDKTGYKVYDDRFDVSPKVKLLPEDMKLSNLEIVASSEKQAVTVYGHNPASGKKVFLYGKASRNQARWNVNVWRHLKQSLTQVFESYKGKGVERGEGKCVRTKKYVCFGFRKDPLSKGVSEYTFRSKSAKDEDKTPEIKKQIGQLCRAMEEVATHLVPLTDQSRYKELIVSGTGCPTLGGGCATQTACSKSYWSYVHTDVDYYYSVLTGWRHGQCAGEALLFRNQ